MSELLESLVSEMIISESPKQLSLCYIIVFFIICTVSLKMISGSFHIWQRGVQCQTSLCNKASEDLINCLSRKKHVAQPSCCNKMQFAVTQSPETLSGTPQAMESILFTLMSRRFCEMNKQWFRIKVMQSLYSLTLALAWYETLLSALSVALSICIMATSYSWAVTLLMQLLYVSSAVWSQRTCPFLTCLPYTSGGPWQMLVNSVPVNTGVLHLCLPVPSGRT